MSSYTFVYEEDGKQLTHQIFIDEETGDHTWNKPMSEFFNFLKGIGFVFDMETQIGVVDHDGNFREAEIG